ncbi:MAG: WXG100 family type VII secretion target [Actinomycetota bacterium]|nr:WXG100 family type VII secretion target [Actinomycetota bacterium]
MKFELPNAVAAMNNTVAAIGEDGDSWEIIGDPLTKAVDEVVPEYNDQLYLKLDPSPGAKRAEICTVRWGKIDKDIARLNGLAKAVENVSSVIKSGKETIAHDWKGESYDAFRAQIEKVEKTLNDYVTAVRTTAAGLQAAVDGTRDMFASYRDVALDDLNLPGKFSPPGDWRRMNHDDAAFLADRCTSHENDLTESWDCMYDNEPWRGMIDRKFVNKRLFDQLEKWDCTNNFDVVTGQYNYIVKAAYDERASIQAKINHWYEATDALKTNVANALDAALENLRIIADLNVFSMLAVPGATAPGGDPGPGTGGGDPGPGAGYPGPGATGYPGPGAGGGEVAMPSPEPTPQPEPVAVDPVAAEPEPVEPEPTEPEPTEPEQSPGTVSIKDGDRTFSVSSPDGQGQVKLTVDDGSGTTKSYSLDFNAASGMGPQPGTEGQQPEPEEGVEQVPARSDGKCVIQEGDLTITAERPLFSPDSIAITVDDGTGSPTTYTLDFPEDAEAPTAEEPQAEQPAGAGPTASAVGSAQAQPATEQTAEPDTPAPAETATPAAGADATTGRETAEPAGTPEPAATPGAADQPGHTTSPQSWMEDQKGSLSGVLESNDEVGEAGLASVSDAPTPEAAEATGMAGAGLPMVAGPNGATGDGPGRAGSGWSVHGDLFDSGEPVYSMHGVLGDDDLESQEAQ